MVFSSYAFLFAFLPAVLAGFYALRRFGAFNASATFLLAASFIFYAYWSVAHLALLVGSILVNYLSAGVIAGNNQARTRKVVLAAGIIFNLGLIFIFKYLDFAGSNLAAVTGNEWRLLNILLPLGISFFTFQQIAYLVDCYSTRKNEKSLRNYALFVSFFPQLIAGPIVHHRHTRPQFESIAARPANLEMLPYGLMIFAMGLFKKTMIADPISRLIDPIYAAAAAGDPVSALMSWTAMIGYTLQIYFDFSGYCDMAIGIGLMVGIRLPINFNSPYKAKSIIEFWRRWHITLSNFLRDYVYIPFGGNRGGNIFRLRNIFLTMLIGGVWHGAAWTFIIWGALHAIVITANHAVRAYAPSFDLWNDTPSIIIKRCATLGFVMLAWIFFRADSVPAALHILGGFGHYGVTEFDLPAVSTLFLAGAASLALFAPNSLEIAGYCDDPSAQIPRHANRVSKIMSPTPMAATATAIMLVCGAALAWKPATFIYFNF